MKKLIFLGGKTSIESNNESQNKLQLFLTSGANKTWG